MKKLLALTTLFISCTVPVVKETDPIAVEKQKDEFRQIIPQKHFLYKIGEDIKKFQLTDIRSKALPEKDLEVRIWIGFGLGYLQGFLLNRIDGEWSATYLHAYKQTEKKLQTPISGWDITWEKLQDAGLLTLPDAEEIKCNHVSVDGETYVVEYNLKNNYRTYSYSNPIYPICSEAKQIIEIRNLIAEGFGVLGKKGTNETNAILVAKSTLFETHSKKHSTNV